MSGEILLVIGLSFIFVATSIGGILTAVMSDKMMVKYGDLFSGFSAGIMMSASVFSLLLPSLDGTFVKCENPIITVAIGYLIGCLFMFFTDLFIKKDDNFSSIFIAVTTHNVPEGLAVGFSFGLACLSGVSPYFALAIAVGIGIQNIPEGAVVALSARKSFTPVKSSLFGILSGVVEPIAGLIGYILASYIGYLLPFLMSFSAGAMIYAVFMDCEYKNGEMGTIGGVLGFLFMMILDVVLG